MQINKVGNYSKITKDYINYIFPKNDEVKLVLNDNDFNTFEFLEINKKPENVMKFSNAVGFFYTELVEILSGDKLVFSEIQNRSPIVYFGREVSIEEIILIKNTIKNYAAVENSLINDESSTMKKYCLSDNGFVFSLKYEELTYTDYFKKGKAKIL